MKRTRYWSSDQGSITAVQFRTDHPNTVWLHTSLGWLPVDDTPTDVAEAEQFAIDLAAGYDLTERSQDVATEIAGWYYDPIDGAVRRLRPDQESIP